MTEEWDEFGDLELDHTMVGDFHVYTSRVQPALCVANRDDLKARALIRPQFEAIAEASRQRAESRVQNSSSFDN